jgi:uncharacterized protein (DUF2147 family)
MDHNNHHRILLSMLLGIVCSFIFAMAHAAESTLDSPIGYWKTIDDLTGKPKSIVQIWKTSDEVLMGKVVKIFPKNNTTDQTKRCDACKGDLHNQPIVGMVILSGLTAKQKQWKNGKILDPENGKSYSCAMHTVDHGKKLNVRGFIGLSLLGRSQTWERVDLSA